MYSTNNVRGEHLLWLTPIIYIWLTSINAPIQNFIVYYEGEFYLFNFFSTLVILLLIIAIPYYIHQYLRKQGLRSIVVSWLHIVPTLLLLLSVITIYAYAPPIDRSWKNSPISNPNFLRWEIFNEVAIGIFKALIVVQIVYILYGLVKINQYRAELEEFEEADSDEYVYEDNEVMINPAYKYTWIPKPAEPAN